MITILQKELADYFSSIRFIVLFILVLLASAAGLYASFQGIRTANLPEGFVFLGLFTTSGEAIPSLINLITLLVPIIGIALGFDAINSERSGGTLSRILSQPVYRDDVINGKFLAGIITLSLMMAATILIVFGYGIRLIGVTPTSEEALRLFFYFIFTVIYGAFWMGLAMLFSVIFRRIAYSLVTSIGVWLFLSIFILLIAPAIANNLTPIAEGATTAELIRNVGLEQTIMRFSPNTLFSEATNALLLPALGENPLIIAISPAAAFLLPNPLSLDQSLLFIWPQLTAMIALSVICFATSYMVFMRQEIRAT
jgi:ABC-2 type transport system permease protein